MKEWEVEYTDEFGEWWTTLNENDQEAITFSVGLLRQHGPSLKYPHSSGVWQSRHSHMRELRSQSEGEPIRTFYAFDPQRAAILLIGGKKTGDDRFYEAMVPKADKIYDKHLIEIQAERGGTDNG
ncbi:MAG: type II toxin-antitoxin system RelE/ParE family toxin [Spirochaetaceae bacterium]|jgi:hypothetical protein|nr:type II toxin-antitoxin system RelE/ParE family toxin [Spirochaetaceae bacterium]